MQRSSGGPQVTTFVGPGESGGPLTLRARARIRLVAALAKQSFGRRKRLDRFVAGVMAICAFAGTTRRDYFILSYAAAKSASGNGTVNVSLFRFWNDTFNCLPDFIAASRSGPIAVPA